MASLPAYDRYVNYFHLVKLFHKHKELLKLIFNLLDFKRLCMWVILGAIYITITSYS